MVSQLLHKLDKIKSLSFLMCQVSSFTKILTSTPTYSQPFEKLSIVSCRLDPQSDFDMLSRFLHKIGFKILVLELVNIDWVLLQVNLRKFFASLPSSAFLQLRTLNLSGNPMTVNCDFCSVLHQFVWVRRSSSLFFRLTRPIK